MDDMTINVDELYRIVSKIKRDAMEYVTISFMESIDDGDGGTIPAQLSLSAVRRLDPHLAYDYDCIDSVPADIFNPDEIKAHTNITP